MDEELDEQDVSEIVETLHTVQTESLTLGRLLKIPKAILDSIKQQYTDPSLRLFSVIDEFVKQVKPKPTWGVIVKALKSPLIRQPRLAKRIEASHLSTEQIGMFNTYLHQMLP